MYFLITHVCTIALGGMMRKTTFIRDKRLDKKIPDNYWIAFRRNYPDHVEFRAEELRK